VRENILGAALCRPRGHLRHPVALPNAYEPAGHELAEMAEHCEPGGHNTDAAIAGCEHTEPIGHAAGRWLPCAQNVDAGHGAVTAVNPVVAQ
jgi:hypothetical protein